MDEISFTTTILLALGKNRCVTPRQKFATYIYVLRETLESSSSFQDFFYYDHPMVSVCYEDARSVREPNIIKKKALNITKTFY